MTYIIGEHGNTQEASWDDIKNGIDLKPGQFIRQGDVFITAVAEAPVKYRIMPRINEAVILAFGEVTGHKHQFLEEHVTQIQDIESEKTFLLVNDISNFVHEEHKTIPLKRQIFEVTIQEQKIRGKITRVVD